jgi:hypothetical protein
MKGGALSAKTIKDLLNASYSKKQQNIGDYVIDHDLSGQRAQVYHNPITGRVAVVHRGTSSAKDALTDLGMVFGRTKSSKRFKHSKDIQRRAEEKYGPENISTLGHSLGARIAEEVGSKTGEVITLNKPTLPIDLVKGKKVSDKQYDIRTTYDPVSVLRPAQRGDQYTTIQSESFHPLKEHTVNVLDRIDEETMIGRNPEPN